MTIRDTRRYWGVMFCSPLTKPNGPLYKGWHENCASPRYVGEPPEPLLFTTRKLAQLWCQERHAYYRAYPAGHVCRAWRFSVVRVQRTIRVTS